MAEADLPAVHERLKAILEKHRGEFAARGGYGGLVLELPEAVGKPWGYVAGTRPGKRYVSFYLMGVYARPELLDSMSPALRKRMQGKSCFNFSSVDEGLLTELDALTGGVLAAHRGIIAPELAKHRR